MRGFRLKFVQAYDRMGVKVNPELSPKLNLLAVQK